MASEPSALNIAHAKGLDKKLWDIVEEGTIYNIRRLLKKGANPNIYEGDLDDGYFESSLIHKACHRENVELVRLLITYGADVNTKQEHEGNVLRHAVMLQNLNLVEVLLKLGANINADNVHSGALQVAVYHENLEIVNFLIEHGADIDAQGGILEENALLAAIYMENPEIVNILVRHGADINAKVGIFEENALLAAIDKENLEIVNILIRHGADFNAQGGIFEENALLAAIDKENLEIVNILIRHGADINAQGGYRGNALQVAVSKESLEIVNFLFGHGIDVNAQGGYYGNSLQAAASGKNLDIFKLLISKGANINTEGGYYGNALQAGAARGNLDIVKYLIEQGANVNTKGGHYGNALQAAAAGGNLDIVKALIENGADANAQNTTHGNALFLAADIASLEIVRYLLMKGAKAEIQPWCTDHSSLLHHVTQCQNTTILSALWTAGADVHMTTQDVLGLTPLHKAVLENNINIVQYLLQKEASANTTDFNGTYPIQSALKKPYANIVIELYSKTRVDLLSVSAADWRKCSNIGQRCVTALHEGLYEGVGKRIRFEKLSDFLKQNDFGHEGADTFWRFTCVDSYDDEKCIFMLADGRKIFPDPSKASAFYHQWFQSRSSDLCQALEDSEVNQDLIRKADRKEYDERSWPSIEQIEGNALDDSTRRKDQTLSGFISREGFSWIMIKPDQYGTRDENKNLLESQMYFSTLEYGKVPLLATDLLHSFEQKLHFIWKSNYQHFQKRLSSLRLSILKAGDDRSDLIRDLLHDAQLLEYLKKNFSDQMERLEAFEREYLDDRSRLAHEMPLEQLKLKMKEFSSKIFKLRHDEVEPWLDTLTETCRELIQLEFNLSSIAEAQKSTSTNRSLKRLTWVTFIFLPLLFVASLFGMNVDVLKDNPGWWWYPTLAAITTILTLAVWIVFKLSNGLEGRLEERIWGWYRFLFHSRRMSVDLESQTAKATRRIQKFGSRFSRRKADQDGIAEPDLEKEKRRLRDKLYSSFGKKKS